MSFPLKLSHREALARQIGADSAHRQPGLTVLLDQPPHGRLAPKGEGKTVSVRRVLADQSADLRFLLDIEKLSRSRSGAPPPGGQAGRPCSAKRRQISNTLVRVRPTCAAMASYVRPLSRSPITCRCRSRFGEILLRSVNPVSFNLPPSCPQGEEALKRQFV